MCWKCVWTATHHPCITWCWWQPSTESSHRFVTLSPLRVCVSVCVAVYIVTFVSVMAFCRIITQVCNTVFTLCVYVYMYLCKLRWWPSSTESSHRFVTLSSLCVFVCACICIHCVSDRPLQNHHTGLWYCLYFVCLCVHVFAYIMLVTTLHRIITQVCGTVFTLYVCVCMYLHTLCWWPPSTESSHRFVVLSLLCMSVCACICIHYVGDHPPQNHHTGF